MNEQLLSWLEPGDRRVSYERIGDAWVVFGSRSDDDATLGYGMGGTLELAEAACLAALSQNGELCTSTG